MWTRKKIQSEGLQDDEEIESQYPGEDRNPNRWKQYLQYYMLSFASSWKANNAYDRLRDYVTKRWIPGEERSKWQTRKTLNSSPRMNTSKLQLHIEQLSLKTTWRLAEWLFYNQGYKERTTQSLEGGEEKRSSRDPHPWQLNQKRRRISQARESFLRSEGFKLHMW